MTALSPTIIAGLPNWRKRDFDTAIADENEAIEFGPKMANAYMRRGRMRYADRR